MMRLLKGSSITDNCFFTTDYPVSTKTGSALRNAISEIKKAKKAFWQRLQCPL
jgi:hypothetical protein